MRLPRPQDRWLRRRTIAISVFAAMMYAIEVSLLAPDVSSVALAAMPVVLLGLIVFAARSGRHPQAALVGAGLSLAATAVIHSTILQRTFGTVELLLLLVLVVGAARHGSRRSAMAVALAASVASAVLLLRSVALWWNTAELGLLLILVTVAAMFLGLHLREEDLRRTATAEQVRRAERLDLAGDLHDHVAHYVTAMVVQAQAGHEIVEGDPATGRQLFANIESIGQEGLTAMSRMVGLLREGAAAEETRTVPQGLTAVHELAARNSATGPQTSVEVRPGVDPGNWSAELSRSVQRLVQEGLTNVRKHAHHATSVRVVVDAEGDDVVVRVRDDGTKSGRVRFRSSGFGLIGLQERVSMLGGTLSSAAQPEGGWELRATLPRTAKAVR
ncbi:MULTISPECIES: sensor histidine kinase [Actinoalloteichus]|uniref:histidine kinase n=1 Tax=Actinoalloteichus fjordicus TaxID=1612552 RepID=A0AAC9L8S7_9PSEU|nr:MULTISPECIES: histidine kinase [Actinoalloteichus]APU13288.1 signal transduction histidine kinase [Actinoalloteichus fjordicus]APU19239.1 signal transduction histidine kinase [Actinoalloteichus sp. GBA129-24]